MDLLSEFHQIPTQFVAWVYFLGTLFVGVIMGIILGWFLDSDKGYKQGQIDALNGKIFYKKEENENKEMVWTEIKSK